VKLSNPTRQPAPGIVPVRPWAQRAARSGLWGLIGLSAIGGVAGLLRPTGIKSLPTPAPIEWPVPAYVTGFAEYAVRSWLAATPELNGPLDALFLDPPEPSDRHALHPMAVTAIGARPESDGYWAVTVAAVVESLEVPVGQATTLFFEIGIVESDDILAAAATPALVAAPPSTVGSRPAPTFSAEAGDPIAATLEGFFRSLLVGDGDISRYLAPGTVINAVVPAPFVHTEVIALSERRAEHDVVVRVELGAAAADGAEWTLGYEVSLVERDDRWEVSSISGAPAVTPTTAEERSPQVAPDPTATTSATVAASPGA
jgi:hypothetical protein